MSIRGEQWLRTASQHPQVHYAIFRITPTFLSYPYGATSPTALIELLMQRRV